MPRSENGSRRASVRRRFLAVSLATLLAGCGSTNEIERPSTYVGAIAEARLNEVYLAAPGGKQVPFMEVFKGFEPETGFMTTPLPFPKVAVADIIYGAAQPVAEYYDSKANNNGYLEGPELLVLYIRESAIGLGQTVDYLGVNPRFDALATTAADTGGLMRYVKANKGRMTEATQKMFKDIEQIGLDRRTRGGGGAGGASGGGGR
jgi:hypothetical protein